MLVPMVGKAVVTVQTLTLEDLQVLVSLVNAVGQAAAALGLQGAMENSMQTTGAMVSNPTSPELPRITEAVEVVWVSRG
tara:strand:- start:189 stop:425 length:237 start_codon:yes stop_codon:yes gene_type:complete